MLLTPAVCTVEGSVQDWQLGEWASTVVASVNVPATIFNSEAVHSVSTVGFLADCLTAEGSVPRVGPSRACSLKCSKTYTIVTVGCATLTRNGASRAQTL